MTHAIELRTKGKHRVANLYESQGILEFADKGNLVKIHYPPGTPISYKKGVKPYESKVLSIPIKNQAGTTLAFFFPQDWVIDAMKKGEYLQIRFPKGTKLTQVKGVDKP